jgi:hypothetical protein
MSKQIAANRYAKKNPGRMASFSANCQTKGGKLGTGTESFQQKFDRLFDLKKFLDQHDEIYCLEMAILLQKITIQSRKLFLIFYFTIINFKKHFYFFKMDSPK